MSEALSTSPARPPSACPTWLPNIAPPAWPSSPISGPAICCASGGSAPPIADTTCSATGSTSTFQTSMVCSTHSARLQAADEVTPEENSVDESSQWSASRSASAISPACRSVGDGSGCSATVRRATSLASVQFTEPSCGDIIACIWLISADRSGMPPPPGIPGKPPPAPPRPPNALKICSNGVPLKGLGCSSSGRSPGSFVMTSKLLATSNGRAVVWVRSTRDRRPARRTPRRHPGDPARRGRGARRAGRPGRRGSRRVRRHRPRPRPRPGRHRAGLLRPPDRDGPARRGRGADRREVRRDRGRRGAPGRPARDRGRRRHRRHRRRAPRARPSRRPARSSTSSRRPCRSGSTRSSPTAPTSGSARRRAWLTGNPRRAA